MVQGVRGIPALITDLGIRGIWQPQAEALFEIQVVNTVALSYMYIKHTAHAVVLKIQEVEAAQSRCSTFSPHFVVGFLGCKVQKSTFLGKKKSF